MEVMLKHYGPIFQESIGIIARREKCPPMKFSILLTIGFPFRLTNWLIATIYGWFYFINC
jgi:hypothetical protein